MQTALKREEQNFFFLMKFYHDKRSAKKLENITFPLADTIDLVGFDSFDVTRCILDHVLSNFHISSQYFHSVSF